MLRRSLELSYCSLWKRAMKSHYWTTLYLWLAAVAATSAESVGTVMTWYIGSDGRNETVQFTGDTFAQFSRCVCTQTQTSCTVYTANGFMSYVQWGNPRSTQGYTNTYICERVSNLALFVGCSRLEFSSCSDVASYPFWSFRTITSQEACGIGQVKIIWNSTQQFQMTYNNTSLSISKGNLTCPSSSVPAGSTTLPTQPSQSSTNNSSCFPKCSTTPETNITTNGNKTTQSGDDDDTGVIVGVVVTLLVCAVLVTVGLVLWWRKKKAQKAEMYGSSQLWSQPVEILNGGFNGFAEQGSGDRPKGNAYVKDSTEPSYATVSADHAISNGNNTSYYNLRHNGNTSASAYENTGGTASATSSGGDRRNIRHFGQDADGYELPLPATASQTLSQRYPNTRQGTVKGDSMEYEDVDHSPSACLQTGHDYSSQSQPNYDSYDVAVSPGAGQPSYKDTIAKDDTRYESVHLGGPRTENDYSEINDNTDNINLKDIVPPKRNRFLKLNAQTQNEESSVYELAQPINERSANPDGNDDTGSTVHRPYARPAGNQSKPVNPYRCDGGIGNVYDSGSHTYFELESSASIRVEDTDI